MEEMGFLLEQAGVSGYLGLSLLLSALSVGGFFTAAALPRFCRVRCGVLPIVPKRSDLIDG